MVVGAIDAPVLNAFSPDGTEGLSLLEHLAVLGEKACKNVKAPILFGKDLENQKALVIKANCKQWNCETCGARKTKYWMARALDGTRVLGGQWFFMTITPHESWKKKGQSLANLRKNWDKLRKRIIRAFGKFEYLKIFEHFKDDEYHLHFIANCEIPYKVTGQDEKGNDKYSCKWLKDNSRACGMGFMTDYQPIRSPAGTAYYLVKYVAKNIGDAAKNWEKNLRRIEASHGFPKLPDLTEETDIEWTYVQNEEHLEKLCIIALGGDNKLFGLNYQSKSVREILKDFRKVRGFESHGARKKRIKREAIASVVNDRLERLSEEKEREIKEARRKDGLRSIASKSKMDVGARHTGYSAYFTKSANENGRILGHPN